MSTSVFACYNFIVAQIHFESAVDSPRPVWAEPRGTADSPQQEAWALGVRGRLAGPLSAPAMGDEDAAKRLFGLGSQAVKAGDYDSAHAQFSEALGSASSVELKSALLVSRSGALGNLSRWSEALADAEACRQIRPSWSRTFECKAAALGGLGRKAEAEMCTRLAAALASLKQDPKNEVSGCGFSAGRSSLFVPCP